MKKLFTFLVVTALLVSTFSLSALASDDDSYNFGGYTLPFNVMHNGELRTIENIYDSTENGSLFMTRYKSSYDGSVTFKLYWVSASSVVVKNPPGGGNNITLVSNSPVTTYEFKEGSANYYFTSSGSNNKSADDVLYTVSGSAQTFVWTGFDIYHSNGSLVYPEAGFHHPPLWAIVQGVTEGETVKLLPTVGGVMKILTACGVGLVALLMVFPLFGKLSKIFPLR